MKRRSFIKKVSIATAGSFVAPYILPSGRLFASTGSRIANHVVFVLFAGGIRNQESVGMQYLASQQGYVTQGNVMNNILEGTAPSNNLVYDKWAPVLSTPLSKQGTLFQEMIYKNGPTGHYNGHTVAITGNYTNTGLNLNVNPENPTVFEYYRKHTAPSKSAINAWWLSEGLGPYPSLNYSKHPDYGSIYGANYFRPATTFSQAGLNFINSIKSTQPDDVPKVEMITQFLNNNFDKTAADLPGIVNHSMEKEQIKKFMADLADGTIPFEFPTPDGTANGLTGDLINIGAGWKVLEQLQPELLVLNTTNLDICHNNFTGYIQFLHKADYGIGWLWDKIQSHPVLANDTILICMPEHGRNMEPNSLRDPNGLLAYDHTSDNNSRRMFSLIVGPPDKVKQGQVLGTASDPVGEPIDIIPTIAHILGFKDQIPAGMLPGKALTEAFA